MRGSGDLNIGGVSFPFEAGDVLFVEAGIEHRFGEFTDDLATWAIFFN